MNSSVLFCFVFLPVSLVKTSWSIVSSRSSPSLPARDWSGLSVGRRQAAPFAFPASSQLPGNCCFPLCILQPAMYPGCCATAAISLLALSPGSNCMIIILFTQPSLPIYKSHKRQRTMGTRIHHACLHTPDLCLPILWPPQSPPAFTAGGSSTGRAEHYPEVLVKLPCAWRRINSTLPEYLCSDP